MSGKVIPEMTPWREHCHKWQDGCGAGVCELANRICLGRGQLPCHVVLIGEAPGKSEDVLGRPFVGPAGQLLQKIVDRSLGTVRYCAECLRGNYYSAVRVQKDDDGVERDVCEGGHCDCKSVPLRWAMTNLVGCMPRAVGVDEGESGGAGGKSGEPTDEQVRSCAGRLRDFVEIADPRLIVCVGKIAHSWLDPTWKHSIKLHRKIPLVRIDHPSYILRANIAQRGLLVQRCIVTLTNAAEELR